MLFRSGKQKADVNRRPLFSIQMFYFSLALDRSILRICFVPYDAEVFLPQSPPGHPCAAQPAQTPFTVRWGTFPPQGSICSTPSRTPFAHSPSKALPSLFINGTAKNDEMLSSMFIQNTEETNTGCFLSYQIRRRM